MNIERGRLNAMLSRKNLFENKSVNATFHGSFKIESNKTPIVYMIPLYNKSRGLPKLLCESVI